MSDNNENSQEIKIEKHNIIFVAILVIAIILCVVLKSLYEQMNMQLAMLGTIASVVGLWVAIDQIVKTKKIARQTSDTAADTLKEVKSKISQVNKAFTLSDVSFLAKLPSTINECIEREEYERAYDKMERLQEGLIELRHNPDCSQNVDNIESFVADLTIRLKSVNKSITSHNKPYKYDEIYALMNQIRIFLLSKSSKMKYDELCGG